MEKGERERDNESVILWKQKNRSGEKQGGRTWRKN